MAKSSSTKSSIGSLLLTSFASVGLLMILGGGVALLQLNVMRKRAEYLSRVDQPALAVLRVHTDFLTFQRDLRELAVARDAAAFASGSDDLNKKFAIDVSSARQSLASLPPGAQRDSQISSLDSVRHLFAEQIESLRALAAAGDWNGVDLRIASRLPVIDELSESVVRHIEAISEIEKTSELQGTVRAQRQATWTLLAASVLALLAAGFLAARVTRNIAGRLEKLDTAARFMAQGKFQEELPVAGNDEIAGLSRTFNEMSSHLQSLYAQLQQSEAHFRSLIENASDFILILSDTGVVRYASPSTNRALGQQDSLVGQTIFDLIDPGDASPRQDFWQRIMHAAASHTSIELRTSNAVGPRKILLVYATDLLQDPSVAGIVLNARDVTGVKALEDQLRQSQRMEAIGTLSGGIAHDFNNLLTIIRGYTYQLLDSPHPSPEARAQITRIDDAAERAATLTRQLLAFSRRQMLEPKIVDVSSLINNLHPLLRRLIGEDIEIQTLPSDQPCTIHADPSQVEQVIMNLAVNARDAMPNGGKLTIETACLFLDQAYAHTHPGASPGSHVMLAVSDTGEGMTAETQARIFEPFFTTKGLGKGTGLGLSTVYGIVKQSGGHTWVYSELGHGTTFKVYFPRVSDSVDVAPSVRPAAIDTRGHETILVVEDEPLIRELVEMMLSNKGYSVLTVDDPLHAEAFSRQYPGPIQLLITDVVLPGISGREVARQLSAQRPDLKVLFTSGYTPNAIVHHGVLDDGIHFMQKPFTSAVLATKVREVLDGAI